MMYLMHEESVSGHRQMTTIRPLDGRSEGRGLAICIEYAGRQVDVTLNAAEAREFAEWCMAHTEPNAGMSLSGDLHAGAVPRRGSDVGTSPLLAVSGSGDK